MTHSQENVTDLPERVLLVASGPQKSSGHFYLSTSDETGAAIYVPEQRALAAEQERDYLTLCLGEANASKEAAHEEVAALREQVRVLTPLARLGLAIVDGGSVLHRAVLDSEAAGAIWDVAHFESVDRGDGGLFLYFDLDVPRALLAARKGDEG